MTKKITAEEFLKIITVPASAAAKAVKAATGITAKDITRTADGEFARVRWNATRAQIRKIGADWETLPITASAMTEYHDHCRKYGAYNPWTRIEFTRIHRAEFVSGGTRVVLMAIEILAESRPLHHAEITVRNADEFIEYIEAHPEDGIRIVRKPLPRLGTGFSGETVRAAIRGASYHIVTRVTYDRIAGESFTAASTEELDRIGVTRLQKETVEMAAAADIAAEERREKAREARAKARAKRDTIRALSDEPVEIEAGEWERQTVLRYLGYISAGDGTRPHDKVAISRRGCAESWQEIDRDDRWVLCHSYRDALLEIESAVGGFRFA